MLKYNVDITLDANDMEWLSQGNQEVFFNGGYYYNFDRGIWLRDFQSGENAIVIHLAEDNTVMQIDFLDEDYRVISNDITPTDDGFVFTYEDDSASIRLTYNKHFFDMPKFKGKGATEEYIGIDIFL